MTDEINRSYIKTLVSACELHRPAACYSDDLRSLLNVLASANIRRPNDFDFQYTGPIELRWYDGPGDCFGRSTKWAGAVIGHGTVDIRGNTSKRDYSGEGGISIKALLPEDASSILAILLRVIDAEGSPQ